MSYILDALRKADAQRLRDPGRGIHAQPAAADPLMARSGRRPALLVGLAVATLLLLGGAWLLAGEGGGAAAPQPQPAARSATPAGAAFVIAPPAAEVLPPPATAIAGPAPAEVRRAPERSHALARAQAASAPVAAPTALAPAALPAPGPIAAAPPATPQSAAAPVALPAPAVIAAPVAAMPASAPVVPADRIYALAELPADVQQALPKLTVSGGVFSENVAQRMLIVNGQVFNEGSEVAPGVVLERIRQRVAWLRFRGLRISHPY